jgi:hypothetical protein
MSVSAIFDDRDRTVAAEFNPKRESCATCRFWMPNQYLGDDPARTDELGFGFCRRRPPRLVEALVSMAATSPPVGRHADMDELFPAVRHFDATAYPGTFHNEWCGEFEWLPRLQPVEMPIC